MFFCFLQSPKTRLFVRDLSTGLVGSEIESLVAVDHLPKTKTKVKMVVNRLTEDPSVNLTVVAGARTLTSIITDKTDERIDVPTFYTS